MKASTIEYYEPGGDKRVIWKFVLQKDGGKHDFHLSLGSYDTLTDAALAMGDLKPGQRAYHLDAYWKNGRHETYQLFKEAPDYGVTRELVISILKGERKPVSSTEPE